MSRPAIFRIKLGVRIPIVLGAISNLALAGFYRCLFVFVMSFCDQPPRIRRGVIVRTRIFASCLDLGGRAGRRAATFGLSRDDPFIDQ